MTDATASFVAFITTVPVADVPVTSTGAENVTVTGVVATANESNVPPCIKVTPVTVPLAAGASNVTVTGSAGIGGVLAGLPSTKAGSNVPPPLLTVELDPPITLTLATVPSAAIGLTIETSGGIPALTEYCTGTELTKLPASSTAVATKSTISVNVAVTYKTYSPGIDDGCINVRTFSFC